MNNNPNSTPEVISSRTYRVEDIAHILDISRSAAYSLVDSEPPFKIIRIGTAIRISRQSFDAWLTDAS